jgi:hypothetical protein
MFDVKIDRKLLERLRMLMDWQLVQMGYDPMSITLACMDLPRLGPKPKHFSAS